MGADAALELSEEEATLLAEEAQAAAGVLPEPRAARAAQLAQAARAATVPEELLDVLADILLASIQGGRARRRYRAEGERLLTGLLLRTPRGRQLQAQLDAVNTALRSLAGQRLEGVRVGMRAPGSFTVTLTAERFAITLAIRPDGVSVDSVSA